MSQHDQVISDAAGAPARADINSALAALFSQSSGATEPSVAVAYMLWADTTSGWLKQRNAANSGWIKRFPLGTAGRVDAASAATLDLDSVTSDYLRITGTTGITAVTLAEGQRRIALAAAATPITHGASLILPGAASYTCAAGDLLTFIGEAVGVVRVGILRADGTAVVAPSSGFVTGMGMDWFLAAAPSGWVFAAGTIGDASSSATNRANADCQALFTALWTDYADAQAPVSGGRGINAAADWAAHKTIGLPDARGRTTVGMDTMIAAANRLTTAGSGVAGATLGASGGAQNVALTTAQLASHGHNLYGPGTSSGGATNRLVFTPDAATPLQIQNLSVGNWSGSSTPDGTMYGAAAAGSGDAHNNTQPSLVCNKIIKL